jgi:hypothetical protein
MITRVPVLAPSFWNSLSSAPNHVPVFPILSCSRPCSPHYGENNRLRTPVVRFLLFMKLLLSITPAALSPYNDAYVRIMSPGRLLTISDNILLKRKYGLTGPKLSHELPELWITVWRMCIKRQSLTLPGFLYVFDLSHILPHSLYFSFI